MKKIKVIILLVILTAGRFFGLQGARIDEIDQSARIKSQFLYGFTKYIAWENQESFRTFNIGILGFEPNLGKELSKVAATKTVQGKPIEISFFLSIDEISKPQMLYVNKASGFDINKILSKIKGKNILLVSENYPFNQSMINFVQINGIQNFELNEDKIKAENLILSPDLKELAITQSDEWQRLYLQSQGQLESEKEKVEKQKKALSELAKEGDRQRRLISLAGREIDAKKKELEVQKNNLNQLSIENQRYQSDIKEQMEVLEKQKAAIKQQEESIKLQKIEMRTQLKVLDQQSAKIEKQKEILDAQLSSLEKHRIIIYLSIALLVLFMGTGFVIYRNYRAKKQANLLLQEKNEEIEKQREKSDELLLNILPASTAEELKKNGVATAKEYKNATVLFSDFVNFTKISSKLPPDELVKNLDYCFTKFDAIMDKYGLEKIKTIGDAYMCVGGVPVEQNDNAIKVTQAALEMLHFMEEWKERQKGAGKPFWGIRIGIHTGNLTAGVVGKKKFAYDIWGDTVNIASRIEAVSLPDRINISEEVYQKIKNDFDCEPRGLVPVKGKGDLPMYFVNGAV